MVLLFCLNSFRLNKFSSFLQTKKSHNFFVVRLCFIRDRARIEHPLATDVQWIKSSCDSPYVASPAIFCSHSSLDTKSALSENKKRLPKGKTFLSVWPEKENCQTKFWRIWTYRNILWIWLLREWQNYIAVKKKSKIINRVFRGYW